MKILSMHAKGDKRGYKCATNNKIRRPRKNTIKCTHFTFNIEYLCQSISLHRQKNLLPRKWKQIVVNHFICRMYTFYSIHLKSITGYFRKSTLDFANSLLLKDKFLVYNLGKYFLIWENNITGLTFTNMKELRAEQSKGYHVRSRWEWRLYSEELARALFLHI